VQTTRHALQSHVAYAANQPARAVSQPGILRRFSEAFARERLRVSAVSWKCEPFRDHPLDFARTRSYFRSLAEPAEWLFENGAGARESPTLLAANGWERQRWKVQRFPLLRELSGAPPAAGSRSARTSGNINRKSCVSPSPPTGGRLHPCTGARRSLRSYTGSWRTICLVVRK
jgi:hypothetical protein